MTVHHERWVKREKNQQDATNPMFIIKLSQHVSGIIMSIIRRTIVCTAAYGVLHCNKRECGLSPRGFARGDVVFFLESLQFSVQFFVVVVQHLECAALWPSY